MNQQNIKITDKQVSRLAFISSQAFSIHNFRGSLIRSLIEKDIKIYALAPDYDEQSRAKVRELGAEPLDCSMSRTGINPIRDLVDLGRLVLQLRDLKLDATFSYFIKPVIYGTLAAALAKVPKRFAMIEGAGYAFTDQPHSSGLRRALKHIVIGLYRLALHQAHTVFLLNRDDRQLFVESGIIPAEKVVLLNGIGVDLEYFSFQQPHTEPLCFIMIARLLREKGVCDYVEAARLVKSKHAQARFLLIGQPDLNPDSLSQAEINAWIDEQLIEAPGHVQDVRPWFKQASVFVLPSYYREGLPRSTQEAMAMGRPIITTDTVGCRDTVEDGVNGFKVAARNPQALAKAMLFFADHPENIASMGAASRAIAERNFDATKINGYILSEMGIV